MTQSYVFAGVGGYYASKQGGLAGVFRCSTDSGDWKHALSEAEAFTVFVHPRDPNLVFAGTADGVYRSTDRGQTFRRADFSDHSLSHKEPSPVSTALPARSSSKSTRATPMIRRSSPPSPTASLRSWIAAPER